jgi:hypothetical protein
MIDKILCVLVFITLCVATASWFAYNTQYACTRGSMYDTCHIVVAPHDR